MKNFKKKSFVRIIIFSGLDGCGKSSQIEKLVSYFKGINQKHVVIWARPGSTPILMKLKKIARSLVASLPAEGRSEERNKFIARSKIGRLWFYLSIAELIYIYRVKAVIQALFGYVVICDRYLLDSFIDFKVMGLINSDEENNAIFFKKVCVKTVNFFLDISVAESVRRCEMKWEPFPDTIEEKVKRYEYYQYYIPNKDYIRLDGFENADRLHARVVSFIT